VSNIERISKFIIHPTLECILREYGIVASSPEIRFPYLVTCNKPPSYQKNKLRYIQNRQV